MEKDPFIDVHTELFTFQMEKKVPQRYKQNTSSYQPTCIEQEFFIKAQQRHPTVLWKVTDKRYGASGTFTIDYNRQSCKPPLLVLIDGEVVTTLHYEQSFSCSLVNAKEISLLCSPAQEGFAAGAFTLQLLINRPELQHYSPQTYNCNVNQVDISTDMFSSTCADQNPLHLLDILFSGNGILTKEGKKKSQPIPFSFFETKTVLLPPCTPTFIVVKDSCTICRVYPHSFDPTLQIIVISILVQLLICKEPPTNL